MPVTPQQARKEYEKDKERDMKNVIELVDKSLMKNGSMTPTRISTRSLYGYTLEIQHMYKKLGWNVEVAYDLRDGDYMEFSCQSPH